jgi:hypothetical protein
MVFQKIDWLLRFAVVLCSVALSCAETIATAVLNAEPRVGAPRCARERGERTFRVHYFRIGVLTLEPLTTDDIYKRGLVCFFKTPHETDQIAKILASASTLPGHTFTDAIVRVKIVEMNDDASEHVVAIVENDGVMRCGGVDQILSTAALEDLRRLIETKCK